MTRVVDTILQSSRDIALLNGGAVSLRPVGLTIETSIEEERTTEESLGSPTRDLTKLQFLPAIVLVGRHDGGGLIDIVGNVLENFLTLNLLRSDLGLGYGLGSLLDKRYIIEGKNEVVVAICTHEEKFTLGLVARLFVSDIVDDTERGLVTGDGLVCIGPEILHLVGLSVHQFVESLPPRVTEAGATKHIVRHDIGYREVLFEVIALERTVET